MADRAVKDLSSGEKGPNGLIIIANYEQELEIGPFLTTLRAENPGLDVVLVDDGSKDSSPEIAERFGFRVIRHHSNRGAGAAIRTGIRYARGRYDYVVIMSSNGKMRADEIPGVIEPLVEGRADYVQGSRFHCNGRSFGLSAFRTHGIAVFSLFASAILRRRFTDITCGYRAYRLSLFDHPQVNLDQAWLDRYEMELYIHYYACRLGLRVEEVPVTIDYSHLAEGRKTKMRPFSGWWSLIRPFVFLTTGLKK